MLQQSDALVQLILRQAEQDNVRDPERDKGRFFPSSVGKCNRAIVYQMLGNPSKPKDGRTILILENGNFTHDRIQQILARTGTLVVNELPLKNPKLRISGRLDSIILDPDKKPKTELTESIELKDKHGKVVYSGDPSDVVIVEIKSIKDSGWNYVDKGAKEEHVDQLMLYMEMTGIHRGIVLYENKNTQELRQFSYEYDEARARRIMAKIEFVVEHYEKGELPDREYERNDFQCRYCDYRELCWPITNHLRIEEITEE